MAPKTFFALVSCLLFTAGMGAQNVPRSSYGVKALSGLQVASPVSNETFDSTTVHVFAEAKESVPVSQMQVWDNGVKLGRYIGSSVNAYFNLAPGSHTITVTDLGDQWNVIHWTSVGYSVK